METHELWRYVLLFLAMAFVFRTGRVFGWRRARRSWQARNDSDPDPAQAELVYALERRVAELEERLDFTERLLTTRSQSPPETLAERDAR